MQIEPNPQPLRAVPAAVAENHFLFQSAVKASKIALKELAASLVIGAACAPFSATPVDRAILFGGIGIQVVINVAYRILLTRIKIDHPSEIWDQCYAWIPYLTTAFWTGNSAFSLLHESGHALTAKMLFESASPKIELWWNMAGLTTYNFSKLSSWGAHFGTESAMTLVSGGGPFFSLLFSSFALLTGLIRQNNALILTSAMTQVRVIGEAALAFQEDRTSPNSTQDYVILWNGGLHPAIPIAVATVLPAIVYGCYRACCYRRPVEPEIEMV